jgi:sterol desaturase/sphingolipid hydroxylase (fatty acid hydroxylase superfamily)
MGSLLFPDLHAVLHLIVLGVVLALVLSPLEEIFPAKRCGTPIRKELTLDIVYWFLTPLFSRTTTASFIAVCAISANSLLDANITVEHVYHGRGVLGSLPAPLQAIGILLLSDFCDYWTHRLLHRPQLWPIHAIHHTPEDMSWISSARVHPLNDLITRSAQISALIVLGFSAQTILGVVPFISFYVAFLHSNICWDFGPFRQILVSPAYHRWHHTRDEEGIDRNFAGIFPIWDRLFGTQYFPNRLPEKYGLKSGYIPETLSAHLKYPFVCFFGRKDK